MKTQPLFAAARVRYAAWLRPYRARVHVIWQALSIRVKLSLLFASLILAMTSFFYAFAVFETTREIRIAAVYKGEAIADALKGEVSYSIVSGNSPSLNQTFRRLATLRNDLAYIFLLDHTGEVLAHSDTDMIGQHMTDKLSKESLASSVLRVQFERVDLEGQGQYTDLCDVAVPILIAGKRAATLRIGVSLTQYLLANGPRIRYRMAVFALPFAFFSILIAIKLSDSFTRPLQRMAQGVSEMSRGNYDIQLPLNRRDELGEVAQAFNKMALHVKENFEKVSDMANRDGLTGLYNARFFQEALGRELERAKRVQSPLSVLIFDADRFKRINDRYGHPMGDQILQHISRISKSILRGYDILARYGGEEFIAMLSETSGPQALLLGERLRKVLEQRPYVTDEGEVIKATVSLGVAEARTPYDLRSLISQADQALYRAKETGRNRVILFKPAMAEQSPLQLPSENV